MQHHSQMARKALDDNFSSGDKTTPREQILRPLQVPPLPEPIVRAEGRVSTTHKKYASRDSREQLQS